MAGETEIPLANKIKSVLDKVKFIFKNLVLFIQSSEDNQRTLNGFDLYESPTSLHF